MAFSKKVFYKIRTKINLRVWFDFSKCNCSEMEAIVFCSQDETPRTCHGTFSQNKKIFHYARKYCTCNVHHENPVNVIIYQNNIYLFLFIKITKICVKYCYDRYFCFCRSLFFNLFVLLILKWLLNRTFQFTFMCI